MKADQQERRPRSIFQRPATLVTVGVIMLLLAVDQAIRIWSGGTHAWSLLEVGRLVIYLLMSFGSFFLAYLHGRHSTATTKTDQPRPAWSRWLVQFAALVGAIIGGTFAYWETKGLGWSTAAAGALAVAITALTIVIVWTVFAVVRRKR